MAYYNNREVNFINRFELEQLLKFKLKAPVLKGRIQVLIPYKIKYW